MDEYNEAILVWLILCLSISLIVSLATLLVQALLQEVEMQERLLA